MVCPACNLDKQPVRAGRRVCRDCYNAKKRLWRQNNPEATRKYQQQWLSVPENKQRKLDKRKENWQQLSPDEKKRISLRDHLRTTFGLTLEQYDLMLQLQNGVCAICGVAPIKMRLFVDHCHKTGTIRGLLCTNCNTGLNQAEKDITWLDKARRYLESSI